MPVNSASSAKHMEAAWHRGFSGAQNLRQGQRGRCRRAGDFRPAVTAAFARLQPNGCMVRISVLNPTPNPMKSRVRYQEAASLGDLEALPKLAQASRQEKRKKTAGKRCFYLTKNF